MAENLKEKICSCDGRNAIRRTFGRDAPIIIYECLFELGIKCGYRKKSGVVELCVLRSSMENPPVISRDISVYYAGR
jgi:hypothetical protein